MFSKTNFVSGDGANHQNGIAVTFSKDTLESNILGQITSHSFSNQMVVDSENKFIGIDLGDN